MIRLEPEIVTVDLSKDNQTAVFPSRQLGKFQSLRFHRRPLFCRRTVARIASRSKIDYEAISG